jgi:hypothetical protein
MSEDLFKQALEDAFQKVQKQILKEIGDSEFDWDFFINLFLKEGSPLVHAFSAKTMQYAELYSTAKKMATIADDIKDEDE